MKPFHLSFSEDWPDSPIVNLMDSVTDIPDAPGAYVLGTANETMLVYPWATSPIYYIGMSTSLRRRLLEHRKHIQGATDDYWGKWWWPRYQYGAAFGASCTWFLSPEGTNPKALEAKLVSEFYLRFGSIPTANREWPQTPQQD